MLAVLGAGLGLLAYVGLDLLVGLAARFTPRASEIRIDSGVLLFTLLVASDAAVVFALAPSLASREMAAAVLTHSGSRTTGRRRRVQRGLVVAQIAASVTVLMAAGLLGRTLVRLNAVETGVDVEETFTLETSADHESHSKMEIVALQE